MDDNAWLWVPKAFRKISRRRRKKKVATNSIFMTVIALQILHWFTTVVCIVLCKTITAFQLLHRMIYIIANDFTSILQETRLWTATHEYGR